MAIWIELSGNLGEGKTERILIPNGKNIRVYEGESTHDERAVRLVSVYISGSMGVASHVGVNMMAPILMPLGKDNWEKWDEVDGGVVAAYTSWAKKERDV